MIFENIKLAVTSLISNKMRTFLSLLGIVIGISSVMTIANLGNSLTEETNNMFNDMGVNTITIYATSWDSKITSNFDLDFGVDIQNNVPEIESVVPMNNGNYEVKVGSNATRVSVIGTLPEYKDATGMVLDSGTFFTDEDNYAKKSVVVLGNSIASDLFPQGNAIGRTVKVNSGAEMYLFEVVGVLEQKDALLNLSFDNNLFIPFNSYSNKLTNQNYVSTYVLNVSSDYDVLEVEESLESYVGSVVGEDNFATFSPASIAETFAELTGTMSLVVGAIAAISLLVGGIGIMNIMLVSVTERIKEIGIRKALGATPGNILGQFLVESVMLTFFGGIIGIGLGTWLSSLVSGWLDIPLAPDYIFSLGALVFSIAIGVFFGIYPAWRAAKLDPIDALNHE